MARKKAALNLAAVDSVPPAVAALRGLLSSRSERAISAQMASTSTERSGSLLHEKGGGVVCSTQKASGFRPKLSSEMPE